MTTIGHNGGPTFDAVAQDILDQGILLAIKDVITHAIHDARLERRHLRILAEVIDCLNTRTGTAYPGRRYLADRTRRFHDSHGYTESSVAKTISELIAFGYLISVKRAGEVGGRAVSHYTIKRPSTDELQQHISQWVEAQRRGSGKPFKRSDVTPVGNVTSDGDPGGNVRPDGTPIGNDKMADVTPSGNVSQAIVTPAGNVTPTGNVTSDVTSDVTPVVPTVTIDRTRSIKLGESDNHAGARARDDGRDGETHAGHGVWVNGETIRHAAFVISLPGIRINTVASGRTATEIKDVCLGHALQWAAEIENGVAPAKVVPSKISNFLARTIMGLVNQAAESDVRKSRWEPRKVIGADGKTETQAERLARIGREIEAGERQ